MGLFDFFNNLLYKDKFLCVVCENVFNRNDLYDEVITGHTGICLECLGSLPWVNTSLKFASRFDPSTEIFAPLYYRGKVKGIIKKFKFDSMYEYASVLAYITYYRIFAAGICIKDRYDMIVSVPLSDARMRERGYNQSALIAEQLSRYFEIPYSENALCRIRSTKKQSLLNSENQRYINVHGAFRADPEIVKGKRVLIFDDIYTYGYTMSECADAVKAAGAAKTGAICTALATDGSKLLI